MSQSPFKIWEELDNSKLGSTQQWMTLTCCQDHILTENIWFVWSETSYSGDERRCYRCGTNNDQRTVKIELLSQWKLEAEFRNLDKFMFVCLGLCICVFVFVLYQVSVLYWVLFFIEFQFWTATKFTFLFVCLGWVNNWLSHQTWYWDFAKPEKQIIFTNNDDNKW